MFDLMIMFYYNILTIFVFRPYASKKRNIRMIQFYSYGISNGNDYWQQTKKAICGNIFRMKRIPKYAVIICAFSFENRFANVFIFDECSRMSWNVFANIWYLPNRIKRNTSLEFNSLLQQMNKMYYYFFLSSSLCILGGL